MKVCLTHNFILNYGKHKIGSGCLEKVVSMLQKNLPSKNIKKLHLSESPRVVLYRYRCGDHRILMQKCKREGENCSFWILVDVGDRDEIYREVSKYLKIPMLSELEDPEEFLEEIRNLNEEPSVEFNIGGRIYKLPESIESSHLPDEKIYEEIQRYMDGEYVKYLALDKSQNNVIWDPTPYKFIKGRAGTGKTVVLIHRLLQDIIGDQNGNIKRFVITYNPYISFVIYKVVYKIFGENYPKNLYVYPFDSFVRNFIKGELLKASDDDSLRTDNLLDDVESFRVVKDIMKKSSFLPKNFPLTYEEVYFLIRNVWYGGGCNKGKDFLEKLKKYSMKQELFNCSDSITMIEKSYRNRLCKDGKKNLVNGFYRRIYKALENKDFEENNTTISLYIDEIQDFNEIERNIIFKLCEKLNLHSIFITFDTKQQIHPVGFHENLLFKEIEEIEKEIKEEFNQRENELKIVTLSKNYRCSREINRLAIALVGKKMENTSVFSLEKPSYCIFENRKSLLKKLKDLRDRTRGKHIMFIGYRSFFEDKDKDKNKDKDKDKDIFTEEDLYFHYDEAKGLENDIVILIDPFNIPISDENRRKNTIYMMVTRARKYLILLLCGSNHEEVSVLRRDDLAKEIDSADLLNYIDNLPAIAEDDFVKWLYENRRLNLAKSDKTAEIIRIFDDIYRERYRGDSPFDVWQQWIKENEDKIKECGRAKELIDLYKKFNRFDEAINLCKRWKYYKKGGKIYRDELKDLKGALDMFKKAREWDICISICKELKRYEEAGDIYLNNLHRYKEAENMYVECENWKKCGIACEKDERYEDAINYYKEAGEMERVGDIYRKLGKLREAKYVYKENGSLRKCAEVCIELGEYEEAGNCYSRIGNHESAKSMYRKAKNWQEYAKACHRNGDIDEAIEWYIKTGSYKEVGGIYENYKKDMEKAWKMYWLAGEYSECVRICKELEKFELAGDICFLMGEKKNRYQKAQELYLKANARKKRELASYFSNILEKKDNSVMVTLHLWRSFVLKGNLHKGASKACKSIRESKKEWVRTPVSIVMGYDQENKIKGVIFLRELVWKEENKAYPYAIRFFVKSEKPLEFALFSPENIPDNELPLYGIGKTEFLICGNLKTALEDMYHKLKVKKDKKLKKIFSANLRIVHTSYGNIYLSIPDIKADKKVYHIKVDCKKDNDGRTIFEAMLLQSLKNLSEIVG